MTAPLSDDNLNHLRKLIDLPELEGTKYEFVRKLGAGGMATVYLARDRDLDRLVAIKVVALAESGPALTQRLTREAQIVARLEHPGIVPIHDFGFLADSRAFYVMKYVEGVTLEEFVTQNHNRADSLRVFQKVCDAISFAHSRGVIHRDLKPANIMIGGFGEALVMDWGISVVSRSVASQAMSATSTSDNTPENTAHGTILGTPAYMSPEQARGELSAIDYRTDIYSLGALLYFTLTRKAPFIGDSAESIRLAVAAGSFIEPRQLDRNLPKALNAICLKSMSQNPDNRYQSCSQLAQDVTNFLDHLPVSAYKENIFEQVSRWIIRNKVIVLIVIGYMLVRFLIYLRTSL